MKRIAVTGGSGKLGLIAVDELMRHGYEVTVIDNKAPEGRKCKYVHAQLTDAGEAYGALKGTDAVLHLAAVPGLGIYTHGRIYFNNVMSTYNILEAAEALGMHKAVIGSSESSYGFYWATHPFVPDYFPVNEQHPQKPQEAYGLSKVLNETTAAMFYRNSGLQVVPLRFSTIISEQEWPNLIRAMKSDPALFKRNLYSHVDVRDAAVACRLALETDGLSPEGMNITSSVTLSDVETPELLARYFREVTDIREELSGYKALVSNRQARETLGWEPAYTWQNY